MFSGIDCFEPWSWQQGNKQQPTTCKMVLSSVRRAGGDDVFREASAGLTKSTIRMGRFFCAFALSFPMTAIFKACDREIRNKNRNEIVEERGRKKEDSIIDRRKRQSQPEISQGTGQVSRAFKRDRRSSLVKREVVKVFLLTMAGRRRWAAKLDMYRKVPVDLLEGSKQGSIISWIAIFTILLLFYKETRDYLTTRITSDLMLDRHPKRATADQEDLIRATFNITMMDLKCDYVEVDVVSVLGNNQNVTKFVKKMPIDANGVLNYFAARNIRQDDVEMALHDELVVQTLEELYESGEEAVSLDEKTLKYALNENPLVFVDFFASWCSHCQRLAPTWEVFAKVMNDATNELVEDAEDGYDENELREAEELVAPVIIAKIDCVNNHMLCTTNEIMAYPTLRLYVNGEPFENGDYRGHRTVTDLIQFLKDAEALLGKEGVLSHGNIDSALEKHLEITMEEKHWAEALERTRHHHHKAEWNPEFHPGCQISGSILLHRVPGNFYIQAYSPHHDLVPHMTNVSHEIHHLAFSPPEDQRILRHDVFPKDFSFGTHPLDGNVYVTKNLHEAYHHYIKLITTNDRFFQMLQSTQLAFYQKDEVPEAKFIIDLSPIAVRYRRDSRHWYDYMTSLMAIVGGTFTVVGFVEAGIRRAAKGVSKMKTHK
jgi:thiol-disulfide isomerase/thioredoxin